MPFVQRPVDRQAQLSYDWLDKKKVRYCNNVNEKHPTRRTLSLFGRRLAAGIVSVVQMLGVVMVVICATMAVGGESETLVRSARMGVAERLGVLEHPALKESSGLAASRRDPGVLWTHNDSGGKPRLFACTIQGQHLAVVRIQGVGARDWEDIAAFALDGKAWLLVGDVGDNWARRQDCILYVVEEPVVDHIHAESELVVPVAWKIPFTYEDGPRDCEAVAVDATSNQVLLVSKRTAPVALYTLPLLPEGDRPLVARRRAVLGLADKANPSDPTGHRSYVQWQFQPTAMDVAPDGSAVLVLTYGHAYLFPRVKGEKWETALSGVPQFVSVPGRTQGESGCFSADGRAIFVGSEGRSSPLWQISLRQR